MELITLTTEIRQNLGIFSAHINFDNNDYMIMIKQLSDSFVVFSCPELKLNTKCKLKLFFQSNNGVVECELEVEYFYNSEVMFVVEAKIISTNKNDFFIEFQNLINDILYQAKRKEQRILCTKKNLALLNLINFFFFNYNGKNYKGIIKDISFSGVKILTNVELLQNTDETKFKIKISFVNPEESFFFVCKICRKNLFTFEGHDFAEVVFKLPNNIKFRNRLQNYFNNTNFVNYSR